MSVFLSFLLGVTAGGLLALALAALCTGLPR